MKTTIRVTESLIEKGKIRDARYCPIALAVKKHIREEYGVRAYSQGLQIGSYFQYMWPDKISQWIGRLDEEWTVKPFQFTIDIPDQYLREE